MNHKILYVGMDVHLRCIVIAVLSATGKLVKQTVIETSTPAVRDFLHSLRGQLHVTFEESIHATWLYDVVSPLVQTGGGLQSQAPPAPALRQQE